jgi:predicted metalloendopeptidase
MDEARLEQVGLAPLKADFDRVAALSDKQQIPALIAHFNRHGYSAPYGFGIHQDNKDSTKYVADLVQDGLGLPDRDYYLKNRTRSWPTRWPSTSSTWPKCWAGRQRQPAADAKAIVALETELAKLQWTKVELRDPVKAYNKVPLDKLSKLAPGYDWTTWLNETGIAGKVDYVIVSQPSYITGFNKVLAKTPLATWKVYFQWQVLHANAPYLSKAFAQENFAFYGKVLSGVNEQEPRWKRAVNATDARWAKRWASCTSSSTSRPSARRAWKQLVKNLLAAFGQSIDTLDWMGPETKKRRTPSWPSSPPRSAIRTSGATTRRWWWPRMTWWATCCVRAFEYAKEVNKLGKPIDRDEWGMTPQTVNAYYNPN